MRDLIVFGEDFGGLPSSTQHLISHLAKKRKVLWVNSIGLRKPQCTLRDLKRALSKLLGISKRGFASKSPQAVPSSHFYIANPITLPAPRTTIERKVAKQLLIAQLRPLIQKYELNHPILWTSLPTAADLCGQLGESSVVYYCGDDFSSLAGVDHETVQQHEKQLVENADLILAASSSLARAFPQSKTHYLPHGVNFDLFNGDVSRAKDLPLGKLTVGFYGSLSNWLNYPLIEQVCRENPHWDFVFIGPIELAENPLPKLSNVYYLGPKPHHELPSYCQHWQVGMLPFLANEQISSCNPLKLMEYFSAGCHIVSTPFPALTPYNDQVHIIENAQQFSQVLKKLADFDTRPQHMVEAMKSNSWSAKASQVEQWLEAL